MKLVDHHQSDCKSWTVAGGEERERFSIIFNLHNIIICMLIIPSAFCADFEF